MTRLLNKKNKDLSIRVYVIKPVPTFTIYKQDTRCCLEELNQGKHQEQPKGLSS